MDKDEFTKAYRELIRTYCEDTCNRIKKQDPDLLEFNVMYGMSGLALNLTTLFNKLIESNK